MQFRVMSWARGVLASALLATSVVAAQPATTAAGPGTLVIAGGALRYDNAPVWQRIVDAAGGRNARIAVIAAAAGNPQRSANNTIEALARYGAEGFFVPAAPRLKDADARKAANDPALADRVRAAGGVYFTGGDQGRITRTLVNDDGTPSLLLQAIREVYARGGVLAGSSAGAAIMSETMFFEPGEVIDTLLTGVRDGKEIAPGLGFIGPGVFVDQHVLARGRFARMLPAMLAARTPFGLGVDENTAIVVRAGSAEVLGASGVVAIDLRQAVREAGPHFALRGARVSHLMAGDRIDLATGAVTVAEARRKATRLDPKAADFHAEHTQPFFTWDMLGHATLPALLANLIENRHAEAVGLALLRPTVTGPAPDAQPLDGFEFRFRRTPASLGYLFTADGDEQFTVLDIEFEVRPIRLRDGRVLSR